MRELLNIGGIGFEMDYPNSFRSIDYLNPYLSKCKNNVQITIVEREEIKEIIYPYLGEDLFFKYYGNGKELQIFLKGARGIPSGMLICSEKMQKISFELYEQMQIGCRNIDRLTVLLPMRQILNCFDAFIFHSSRIELEGSAVLFTGNSGVGKTTQALLWKQYENVPHLCNDRTILRREEDKWNTYGYIEDGSEPIANPKKLPLGAIVILKQGNQNSIRRINGKLAIRELMGQVFVDRWDSLMMDVILNRIISLISQVPIFLMECVPDRTAVETLKTVLKQENIIK